MPESPKQRIDDDDDAYRKHFLRSDITQALVIVGVIGIVGIAFARNDALLDEHDAYSNALLINRGVTSVVISWSAIVISRAKTGKTFDRALIAILMAIVLSTTHVLSTWQPNHLAYLPVNLVLVSVLWFVMPGPLLARGFAAFALSIVTLRSISHSSLPVLVHRAAIFSHLFAHLLGLPIAIRMARLPRERFRAQLAEQRAHAQLAAEKERAETLSRAKSDFLATMSHEFRTPMNAVLGLSEVLTHSNLTPEQLDSVKTIHKSAEGLLVLLNGLLEHAKIDAGRITLEPTSVNLCELVKNALATVDYQAAEKHLTIDFSFSETTPRDVRIDGPRVRQILVNLLSNAVKFTDTGTVRLTIGSRDLGDQKHEIRICVEDTGIGIAEENIERIFSPFEQAHASLVGNRGGTGLGLAISRNLAELMGGTLTVRSIVGKGSSFEFVFSTIEVTRAERPAAPSVLADSESSPLRILVAEDNRTNQRVATAMLGQLGYAVEIVDNGRLAVEKLENAFYDVIFMDRHMPELDGIEAAKRIRLLPGKRPYIIAMTASAFVNDRATYLNAGMDDFVAKPARLDDLSHVLARARERTAFNGNVGQTVEKPQTNHDALPVYDPAPMTNLRALEAMTMDTPGFVRDLCTEFLRDSAERIGRFPDLVVAHDAQTIEREAHSLKSANASLGALRMSATCAELERLTNGGTVDGCTPLVVRLHGEFLEAKVNIEREMTNLLPHVAE